MTDTPAHITLSSITIARFMRALFHGEKDDLPNWDELYTQYIDMSGMGKSRQYSLMVQVHNLTTRLRTIAAFISLQDGYMAEFGEPMQSYNSPSGPVNVFDDVRKYGHRLTWPATDWHEQLKRMDLKERRNVAELDKADAELKEIEATGRVKESSSTRADFIRMLTMLNKDGYTINKEADDMETLCIMIDTHNEDVKRAQEAARTKQ
jgi:hypothetical protein